MIAAYLKSFWHADREPHAAQQERRDFAGMVLKPSAPIDHWSRNVEVACTPTGPASEMADGRAPPLVTMFVQTAGESPIFLYNRVDVQVGPPENTSDQAGIVIPGGSSTFLLCKLAFLHLVPGPLLASASMKKTGPSLTITTRDYP